MQNDKKSLTAHSFLFGSLIGGVLIIAASVFYVKGVSINYNPQLTYINHFLILTGIFFSVRKYRDEVLNGVITYGKALGAGVLVIGFAALYYGIFIYVLTRFFDATIIQEALDFTEKSLLQSGAAEKDVELLMSIYKNITPGIFAFGQWFSKLSSGFLFSLILAFFFRQNGNLFAKRSIDKFNQSNNQ